MRTCDPTFLCHLSFSANLQTLISYSKKAMILLSSCLLKSDVTGFRKTALLIHVLPCIKFVSGFYNFLYKVYELLQGFIINIQTSWWLDGRTPSTGKKPKPLLYKALDSFAEKKSEFILSIISVSD